VKPRADAKPEKGGTWEQVRKHVATLRHFSEAEATASKTSISFHIFVAPPTRRFFSCKEMEGVLRRAEDERRGASECAPEAHTVRASVPE